MANQVSPKSHFVYDINLIQMAYGIASLGHDVTIVGLQDQHGFVSQSEIDELFGCEPNLKWIQLGGAGSKLLLKSKILFSWVGYLFAKYMKVDCIYARDYLFPTYCARAGIPVYAESHTNASNDSKELMKLINASKLQSFKCLITISSVLKENFISKGVPEQKIFVIANGVDIKKFTRPNVLPASPYDHNFYNVVYAGRLIDENGIPDIIDAAILLPHVVFHLIGGNLDDIERHRKKITEDNISNVILHGIKKHSSVPNYLWHADILLMPYSSNHQNDAWASPLKLYEYLAAGKPIIASNTRMNKSSVSEENVIFFEADSGESLSQSILDTLSNTTLQRELSKSGPLLANTFSYEKRIRKIFNNYPI